MARNGVGSQKWVCSLEKERFVEGTAGRVRRCVWACNRTSKPLTETENAKKREAELENAKKEGEVGVDGCGGSKMYLVSQECVVDVVDG